MPCFAATRSCIRRAPGLQYAAEAVAAAAAAVGPMGSSSARCDYSLAIASLEGLLFETSEMKFGEVAACRVATNNRTAKFT